MVSRLDVIKQATEYLGVECWLEVLRDMIMIFLKITILQLKRTEIKLLFFNFSWTMYTCILHVYLLMRFFWVCSSRVCEGVHWHIHLPQSDTPNPCNNVCFL